MAPVGKVGVSIWVDGHEHIFNGTLVVVLGDNLASQYLGGYKALNAAFRKCRHCLATAEDMAVNIHKNYFCRIKLLGHKIVCYIPTEFDSNRLKFDKCIYMSLMTSILIFIEAWPTFYSCVVGLYCTLIKNYQFGRSTTCSYVDYDVVLCGGIHSSYLFDTLQPHLNVSSLSHFSIKSFFSFSWVKLNWDIFYSEEFIPRTYETHCNHISFLHGPMYEYNSTTYGLRCDSVLNKSMYFHVTNGLVPDIMHDVLEGCLAYEIKEFIKYAHSNQYFQLNELNEMI
uniref:Uncharacterized protein n=1 Tax=Amphimedon queenslandica TaxID=400682 RepID=A0A1X7VTQ9_AMPQE